MIIEDEPLVGFRQRSMSFLVDWMDQLFHTRRTMPPNSRHCPITSFSLWYCRVDCSELNDESSFRELVQRLTIAEQNQISKFVFLLDQKRAFLSLLLQHAMIMEKFHLTDYHIVRTKENKPYLQTRELDVGFWNYNVSHHGDFVCIAASPTHLIGVDIVDTTTRSRGIHSCEEYVNMFRQQLTAKEIKFILSQGDESLQYTAFFLHWSLKEAFIKAIGLGLGFDLLQVEFEVQEVKNCSDVRGTAIVSIHGRTRPDWRIDYFNIDDKHLISIAQGPLADAIESYKHEVWQDRVLPEPTLVANELPISSELKSVSELMDIAKLGSVR
jgi:4'-phosphopantetheinyl transferase